MKAGRSARLHSADHKSLMLLPMLRMIMLKVDIGTEVGAISGQEVKEGERNREASSHRDRPLVLNVCMLWKTG